MCNSWPMFFLQQHWAKYWKQVKRHFWIDWCNRHLLNFVPFFCYLNMCLDALYSSRLMSSFPSYTPVTLRTHDDGRGEKLWENLCDSTLLEYTVETLRLLKTRRTSWNRKEFVASWHLSVWFPVLLHIGSTVVTAGHIKRHKETWCFWIVLNIMSETDQNVLIKGQGHCDLTNHSSELNDKVSHKWFCSAETLSEYSCWPSPKTGTGEKQKGR